LLLGEQTERLQAEHRAAMTAQASQFRDVIAMVQERADDAAVRAERAERLLVRALTARRRWWRG